MVFVKANGPSLACHQAESVANGSHLATRKAEHNVVPPIVILPTADNQHLAPQ